MQPVRKTSENTLTALLQVRNEEGRYLNEVLSELSDYVDDMVIVDDASTDRTVEICQSFPKVKEIIPLPQSQFNREWELRSTLWREGCKYEPDWVLAIDADEVFESSFKTHVRDLINQDQFDWVSFRMYDFWGGRTHYREDEFWNLHRHHTMMLVRYLPDFPYYYIQQDHHVNRLPLSYGALTGYLSDIRVKHYGWAGDESDRKRKYDRYMSIDPEGKWGNLQHYKSILDPFPNLVEWEEGAT
ncbi:glycosyltransferase family 2 protein [Bacillus sp. es.036]|uniref:glycosyltransferase family 2 protein n=1 Tax=Bacillus sp. es.036 TaxID=1761764 RepID=UPI000BF57F3A|nr:glycosyltransferase family 2 protein [Bacillus sp. es.036]PFG12718.1 glycosyltransferase involved in cell wall biosynthesis [Bacillus sp. es.036]